MHTVNKYLTATLFLIATFGFAVKSHSQSTEESAANGLPLPSVLFKKHIEAVGGEQLLLAHTTKTIQGKMSIKAMGIEGDLLVIAAAPNNIMTTIGLGQYGQSRSGYNGTIAWSMDPMSGNRILKGEALQQMIKRADFYGNDVHLGKGAVKQETVGIVTFGEDKQFKVLLVNADGEESYLYFSKESGLLSGMDSMELSMTGKVPTQTRLSNYVETDGIKTAHRITSSQNGVLTIIEIDSISYSTLADNAFALPAEIQSQVGK
ncbi:MAG TPA: hypothetical protein VKA08_11145 [Balneolales bacterium]|nr:hypothetical protein [Balneolales bacterium]